MNKKEVEKKLAILDFDGTLSKGYISMDFMEYLNQHNPHLYNHGVYGDQQKLLNNLEKGEINYEKWIELWANLWAEGIYCNLKKEMDRLAEDFFTKFKKNIYPSSYKLVKILKANGYYVVLLSVGSYEVISLAGKELGVDEVIATRCQIYEKHGGEKIYTDKLITGLHLPGGKKKALEKILKREEFSLEESLAAGDSEESDLEVLKMVDIPIALNPHIKLRIFAEERGWHIADHTSVLDLVKKIA